MEPEDRMSAHEQDRQDEPMVDRSVQRLSPYPECTVQVHRHDTVRPYGPMMREAARGERLHGLGDACGQKRQARQNLPILRGSGAGKRKEGFPIQPELCVNSKGSSFFFCI